MSDTRRSFGKTWTQEQGVNLGRLFGKEEKPKEGWTGEIEIPEDLGLGPTARWNGEYWSVEGGRLDHVMKDDPMKKREIVGVFTDLVGWAEYDKSHGTIARLLDWISERFGADPLADTLEEWKGR